MKRDNDGFLELIGNVALGFLAGLLYEVINTPQEEELKEEFVSNETEDLGYAVIVEDDDLKQIK